MATAFPGGVDSFPRPGSTTNTNDAGFELDILVDNLSDAMEAMELPLLGGARRVFGQMFVSTGGTGYGFQSIGMGGGVEGTVGPAEGCTLTTAAVSASGAGCMIVGNTIADASWLPSVEFKGKFSTLTNVRIWAAGMGMSPYNNGDLAGWSGAYGAARGAGIRFSTPAGDTTFKYCVSTTTGNYLVDSGVTPDTNDHSFQVSYLTPTKVRFSIDGGSVQIMNPSGTAVDFNRWQGGSAVYTQAAVAVSQVPRELVFSHLPGGA